uniref:Family with sequence similarity 114 member A2 n=1 Tax=Eptatretus burgeri TaxID=7764 RepID=A0A8C4R4Y9_EPTBU
MAQPSQEGRQKAEMEENEDAAITWSDETGREEGRLDEDPMNKNVGVGEGEKMVHPANTLEGDAESKIENAAMMEESGEEVQPFAEEEEEDSVVIPTRKRPEHIIPQVEIGDRMKEPLVEDGVQSKAESSGGGWGSSLGSWGMSLISSATATVSSVGHTLSHVVEKAEESLGILSPTELSAEGEETTQATVPTEEAGGPAGSEEDPVVKEEGVEVEGDEKAFSHGGAFGMLGKLGGMTASSITSIVQNTSKTVITGGLDALELIGKKTMDILAEGDPGFKRTKGLIHRTNTLSQVLREAKEKEEQRLAQQDEDSLAAPKAHYGLLFDEFQGLSHLEALEMLSHESDGNLQAVLSSLSGEDLLRVKAELDEIKSAMILEEIDVESDVVEEKDEKEQDLMNIITELLFQVHIGVTPDKLNRARQKADAWLKEVQEDSTPKEAAEGLEKEEVVKPEKKSVQVIKSIVGIEHFCNLFPWIFTPHSSCEPKLCFRQTFMEAIVVHITLVTSLGWQDVHSLCIQSLAEVTARSIEQLHKCGELILHGADPDVSAMQRAASLTRLTVALCKELSVKSEKFASCLSTVGAQEKPEILNPLVTSVFLEASNSTMYIQDGFQLLLPILQLSHLQHSATPLAPT